MPEIKKVPKTWTHTHTHTHWWGYVKEEQDPAGKAPVQSRTI